ncbi:MAG: heavy metal-associated domain-containing protein [Bacteroidia bacterium]|jgi:copper chaperone CopZ
MKRILLLFIAFAFIHCGLRAQFTSVQVRVDGLTCSACSYATQKSLYELDFIDSVKMDLNTNLATITFKESKKVDIDQIAQKVTDAGFSVGQLTAVHTFNGLTAGNNACFDYLGDKYGFTNTNDTVLNGPATLLFIGKKFMSKAQLKKWKGVQSNCKTDKSFTGKTYIVTIQ